MKSRNRFSLSILSVLMVSFFTGFGGKPLFGQNLIQNPGFEQGMEKWTTYHGRDFFEISEEKPHSGAKCLKISGIPEDMYNAWAVLINPELPVKTNSMYRVSFFYRSSGQNKKDKGFAVGVKPSETIATFLLGQEEWQKYVGIFVNGPRSGPISLFLITYNLDKSDRVYFDDVSVEEITAPAAASERKEFFPDEHTLLLSHFNSGTGADFQRGAATFEPGMPSLTCNSGGFVGEGLWADLKPLPEGFPFTSVAYPTQGNVFESEGTLECWISSNSGLDANDKKERRIFTCQTTVATTLIDYTYISIIGSSLVVSIQNDEKISGGKITADVDYWKKNEWHHIAVCCKKDAVGLFVDGLLMSRSHIPGGLNFKGSEMTIGNCKFYPWAGAERAAFIGIIDELRISDVVRYSME